MLMLTETLPELSKEAKSVMANNPEKALQLAARVLEMAKLASDKEAQSEALFVMGVSNHRMGNSADAVACFNQRMELVNQTGDHAKIAAAHNNLGNVLCGVSDYSKALDHFFRALKYYEETGNSQHIASTKTNMGIAFKNLGRLNEALEMYESTLLYAERNKNNALVVNSYLNIGAVLDLQEKYEEGYEAHQKALALCAELNDKYKEAEILNNVGFNQQQRHLYKEALATYERCLDMCREQHFSVYELRSLLNLGQVHTQFGDYIQAEACFNESLGKAIALADKNSIRAIYRHLSELYEKQGLLQQAFDNYKKYVAAKEEVLNMENLQHLGQLQMRYEMDRKAREAEIDRLKHVELKLAYDSLQTEKQKSETLLLNILPEEVATELKEQGYAKARRFENVTVMFTDFKNFTKVSEQLTPEELVGELHECFKGFDEIIDRYNIEKIKTVGDAYMAASGLPTPCATHATDMVKAAFEICAFMERRRQEKGGKTFELRIGINSGNVVAGIVGMKKFAYDIWGDTVNIAARMEQSGFPGKVNISEHTYQLVKDAFNCEYRGEIEAKNKGKMRMYFVSAGGAKA